jgi:hypothetical protein
MLLLFATALHMKVVLASYSVFNEIFCMCLDGGINPTLNSVLKMLLKYSFLMT